MPQNGRMQGSAAAGLLQVGWASLVAAGPWLLLFAAVRAVLSAFVWPPIAPPSSWYWLGLAARDGMLVLPFVMFAAGVSIMHHAASLRWALVNGVAVGLAAAALVYALGAWTSPLASHRDRLSRATADSGEFEPRTPPNVVAHLRLVEGNPPAAYSLRVEEPARFPPNVLRWELHDPIARAVLAPITLALGVLTASVTLNAARGRRRNLLLATGIGSATVSVAVAVLLHPHTAFLDSGEIVSGVAAAWAPIGPQLLCAALLALHARVRTVG